MGFLNPLAKGGMFGISGLALASHKKKSMIDEPVTSSNSYYQQRTPPSSGASLI